MKYVSSQTWSPGRSPGFFYQPHEQVVAFSDLPFLDSDPLSLADALEGDAIAWTPGVPAFALPKRIDVEGRDPGGLALQKRGRDDESVRSDLDVFSRRRDLFARSSRVVLWVYGAPLTLHFFRDLRTRASGCDNCGQHGRNDQC